MTTCILIVTPSKKMDHVEIMINESAVRNLISLIIVLVEGIIIFGETKG